MHRREHLTSSALVFLVVLLLPATSLAWRSSDGGVPHVGAPAPVLVLPTLNEATGRQPSELSIDRFVGLEASQPAPLCVLLFASSEQLSANLRAARRLHARFHRAGVAVLVVAGSSPNAGERLARRMPYPVLQDAFAVASRSWGVGQGSHLFVIDRDGIVLLEGPVAQVPPLAPTAAFLRSALSRERAP